MQTSVKYIAATALLTQTAMLVVPRVAHGASTTFGLGTTGGLPGRGFGRD